VHACVCVCVCVRVCVCVCEPFFFSKRVQYKVKGIDTYAFVFVGVCVIFFTYVCLCPTENTDKTHGVSFGNWNSELGMSCS